MASTVSSQPNSQPFLQDPVVLSSLRDSLGISEMFAMMQRVLDGQTKDNAAGDKADSRPSSRKRPSSDKVDSGTSRGSSPKRDKVDSDSESLDSAGENAIEDGELIDTNNNNNNTTALPTAPSLYDKIFKKDQLAPDLQQEFAERMNRVCTGVVDASSLNELKHGFARPGNTEFVVAPKINQEFWENKLPDNARDLDRSMFKAQNSVITGLYGVMRIADLCEELLEDNPGDEFLTMVSKIAQDSSYVIGQGSFQWSMARRENFRMYAFQDQYKTLCNKQNPMTAQLFGDDASGTCKKLDDTKKVMKNVMKGDRRYSSRGGSSQFSKSKFPRYNRDAKFSSKKYTPHQRFQPSNHGDQSFRNRPSHNTGYKSYSNNNAQNYKKGSKNFK
jgi:hypothetical protein